MKHLLRDSQCSQPYTKEPGTRDRVIKTAPRVWVATTWCGLGFHGEGPFPHETLRHRMDDGDDWCPGCLEDKAGVMANDREFARPDLRAEADRQ